MAKKKVSSVDLLNSQLKKSAAKPKYGVAKGVPDPAEDSVGPSDAAEDKNKTYSQWNTSDGNIFTPAHVCTPQLPPGYYEIRNSQQIGLYFTRLNISTESILKLPDSNSEKVSKEIAKFWGKEEIFKKYGLTYKRGVLLWGPPGSGKTCTIKLVIDDVVKRGGVALKFDHPTVFAEGLRMLRDIQPNTPVVVIFEDIDSIIENTDESIIINILDGIDRIDKVVFLATTNYPEKLGARICNRPSRFDFRIKIGYPSPEARKMYLEHVFKEDDISKYDIDKWVEDTNEWSIAHLKELFVSVVILGKDYNESVEFLNGMKDNISADEENRSTGFDLE
jgi:SpoVK/Ycf46/Vps4 family AAA+-type ATPase